MAKSEAPVAAVPVTQEEMNAYMEEKVEYTAPIIPGIVNQPDVYAAVNGDSARVRRGETVKIKRKLLEDLRNSSDQQMARMKYQRYLQRPNQKPMAAL